MGVRRYKVLLMQEDRKRIYSFTVKKKQGKELENGGWGGGTISEEDHESWKRRHCTETGRK